MTATAIRTTIRPFVMIKPAAAIRKANAGLSDLRIDYSSLSAAELDEIRQLAETLTRNVQHVQEQARSAWIKQSLS